MPEPAVAPKVTEEQAAEALRALVAEGREEPQVEIEQLALPETPSPAKVEAPAEPAAPEETPEAPAEAATTEGDDVDSLRKRLADAESAREAAIKASESRIEAVKTRSAQNEAILRDRMLRKATVADRALKTLRATRSPSGATEAEVDQVIRDIESTMNPASPSYQQPAPAAEDQALVLNAFLNERGMDVEEAKGFGNWISTEASTKMSPVEQAIAARDLPAFLIIAHERYRQAQAEQSRTTTRDAAVEAAKSVQRTQREAARAAAAPATAPRRQPNAPTPFDVKKLTKDDVSTLLRMSVEQYK